MSRIIINKITISPTPPRMPYITGYIILVELLGSSVLVSILTAFVVLKDTVFEAIVVVVVVVFIFVAVDIVLVVVVAGVAVGVGVCFGICPA